MKKKFPVFNAKILLFGEYTVIFNSKALTIPYTYFSGHLSYISDNKYTNFDNAVRSNRNLRLLLDHFLKNYPLGERCSLNLERFHADLEKGLYFESNIPQGYGVGSSGALVAAIYREYCSNPLKAKGEEAVIQRLKEIFSLMESYFHGTSSGMDPLNCYIGKPLLFESKGKVNTVDVPHSKNNADGAIFLLDSGYAGATEPLVKLFLEKTKPKEFKSKIDKSLIPLTNRSIERIISGDLLGFFDDLYELSSFQYEFMKEMIPEGFIEIWRQGLQTGEYYLKLCGSGGGGFLLGFTRDYKLAENLMKNSGVEIIPVFKNSNFKK